jgi:hypothetical protein
MSRSRIALAALTSTYSDAVALHGGPSLARVATILLNRGSFFVALSKGKDCSLRNFDRCTAWFANKDNWPVATIPEPAVDALASIGMRQDADIGAA